MAPPDRPSGEHRLEAADPIVSHPRKSGLRGRRLQHRQHRRALRRRDADSLQNATRCPCGIAIGTQQAKDAMQIIASTVLGACRAPRGAVRHRRTRTRAALVARAQEEGRERHDDDDNRRKPDHRQAPAVSRDRLLEEGRPTIPATYCPDQMSASAVPRRRSNKRLM